jgi:PAS domain S-box-containing protein
MKARILVVEDEAIVVMEIREHLGLLGYECVGDCASGAEAIHDAGELRPDLVLMDVVLQGNGKDGIAAAQEIHDRFGIPVVYLTAHSDISTLERAKITRPFGFVVKPFSEADLRVAVEIAIHQSQMEKRLRESEEWFRITLNSIGEAVIAVNEEGQITFMNPVAEGLLGLCKCQWFEANAIDIFNIMSEEAASAGMKPGILKGRRGYVSGADGGKIPVVYTSSPIVSDDRGVRGIVIIFTRYTAGREKRNDNPDMLGHSPKKSDETGMRIKS